MKKNLNMSWRNIVNLDHVLEHFIIDWSSNKTIQLENTKNSRVIVKNNEKYYWASRAYNFGVNFVQTDYVLKLDTDTLIDSDKFNKLNYHKYDLIIFYKEKHDPGNPAIGHGKEYLRQGDESKLRPGGGVHPKGKDGGEYCQPRDHRSGRSPGVRLVQDVDRCCFVDRVDRRAGTIKQRATVDGRRRLVLAEPTPRTSGQDQPVRQPSYRYTR